MRKIGLRITLLLMTVLTTACQNRNQSAAEPSSTAVGNPTTPTAAPNTPASNITDRWLGQWIGPEGTYLLLSKNGDRYSIKVQSLDGPATYEGTSTGDRIQFQRNGKVESIRSGNGKETGMKWLLDKKNCLVIQTGEGFCRD